MDGAAYHKRILNPIPNTQSLKADIQRWLQDLDVVYPETATRAQLLQLVNQSKTSRLYAARKIAEQYGHEVLYTPPYHPELQPNEMMWG